MQKWTTQGCKIPHSALRRLAALFAKGFEGKMQKRVPGIFWQQMGAWNMYDLQPEVAVLKVMLLGWLLAGLIARTLGQSYQWKVSEAICPDECGLGASIITGAVTCVDSGDSDQIERHRQPKRWNKIVREGNP